MVTYVYTFIKYMNSDEGYKNLVKIIPPDKKVEVILHMQFQEKDYTNIKLWK